MFISDFYRLHFVTSIAGKPSPSLRPAFKSSGRVQADLQDRPSLYTQVSPFDFLHTHLATDVLPGLLGTKILSLISLPHFKNLLKIRCAEKCRILQAVFDRPFAVQFPYGNTFNFRSPHCRMTRIWNSLSSVGNTMSA